MTGFLTEDFLLSNDAARRLYHQFAAPQPILDYHCHLSPRDIAENRRFANLFEIWLEGDHYKWRAMRANGVAEKYVTGDAPPYEKFLAWARTVPYTLRNPLYHWTHLELQRYFGITNCWMRHPRRRSGSGRMLQLQQLTAQAILQKFHVEVVCTTDDPADDLRHHRAIARRNWRRAVFPAFRPDKALAIGDAEFLPWVEQLDEGGERRGAESGESCCRRCASGTTIFIPWAAGSPTMDWIIAMRRRVRRRRRRRFSRRRAKVVPSARRSGASLRRS